MAVTVVSPQSISTSHWIDVETPVLMTEGNWLVATMVWKYLEVQDSINPPVFNVADGTRNLWTLLSTNIVRADHRVTFTTGTLGVQIWAAPAVNFDGWDYEFITTSLQAFLGIDQSSVVVSIMEISGMGNNYLTVDSVTMWQSYQTRTLAMTAPAPAGAANSFMVAAASVDFVYPSYSITGTGWVQMTSGTQADPDLGLVAAYREATTTGTVTFDLGVGNVKNWTGVLATFRTTGVAPSQPNPNWPGVELQFGYGYDLSQPPSTVWWTNQATYYWAANTKRGVQYELGTSQAEASTITLRNNDGTFSPRNVNDPPVITFTATGTTTTFKCLDAAAADLHVTDMFRLDYAPINPNTDFSGGTTGWTGTGGTFTVTAAVGKIVPTGAATVQVESSHVAVTPGNYYDATGLLQNDVTRTCILRVNWYTSGAVLISSSDVAIPMQAGTLYAFENLALIAPATAATGAIAAVMTGTPAGSNVMFMDNLVLKPTDEFTSFKVTAITSSGGTTTVTYDQTDDTIVGGSIFATKVGDVATFTPIDMYVPYRILMSWQGKREYLCAGWIERWPQTWRDPYWGTVGALGISALATITAANPTPLGGEIQRRNPWAYWPLSDAAGSTTATNVSGRTGFPLVKTLMNAGGGTASSDFGAQTQGTDANESGTPTAPNLSFLSTLIGDPGTAWRSQYDWTWDTTTSAYVGNGPTEINANKGTALVAANGVFPPIAGGVTVFWMGMVTIADQEMIQAEITKNPTCFIIRNTDPGSGLGQGSIIKVAITQGTTNLQVTVWDKNTHSSGTTTSGQQYGVGWTAYALSFTQDSWALFANGALITSGSANLVANFTGIDVAGEADQFFSGNPYPGLIAHVAVFDRFISDGDMFQLTVAGQLGYGGESEITSDRVQRKLDTANMRTGRMMDNIGSIWLDAEGQDSSTVADLNNSVAAYEDAYIFEDAGGVYQYRAPGTYTNQNPRVVLGENVAAGELPYQPGPEIDFDPTYLYNNITIFNSIFNNAAFNQSLQTNTFGVQDDGSAVRYGLRTFSRNTRLSGDENHEIFYLANWLLAKYATTRQRFQTVSLDPSGDTNLWEFCLTVEVLDIVTMARRPLGAPAIVTDCIVLQVSQDTSSGRFITTLTLAPSSPSALILDDTVHGIVGTNYFTME